MKLTFRLLATAAKTPAAHPLRPPPVALLPPIPLYRRLLRAHRKLPPDMRLLGDKYVKDEFKKHKDVENPIHIVGFLTQWQDYAQQLEGETWRDEKLDRTMIDKMSDQQIGQLYELMQAIQKQELGEEDIEQPEDIIEIDKKP